MLNKKEELPKASTAQKILISAIVLGALLMIFSPGIFAKSGSGKSASSNECVVVSKSVTANDCHDIEIKESCDIDSVKIRFYGIDGEEISWPEKKKLDWQGGKTRVKCPDGSVWLRISQYYSSGEKAEFALDLKKEENL
jgi:hypothetical protein